ncbi:Retrovirus-related Pol polyprotein from transposon TNT 1-94 [Vitis vinifera]|uniref:Retrovirus-related Pol polyprotein from transposon TNT 1-94 n=1 Tax=Vitis vinifera TaxID=29760 RepID=A0A438FUE4_VITVI|nr:Retrovirus-related Pol polyprotein from transposon TNT 1-94 [Vitis vinifera]
MGENNFSLWRIKMKALLVHQGLAAAISREELAAMIDTSKAASIQEKAHSAILLCLSDEVLREEGHYKKECPKRKKKKGEKLNQKDLGVAAVASDGYDLADILVVSSNDSGGEWLLDSGCSFHMTLYKNCFQEFQQTEGGMVLLGNNKSCKVLGISSIRFKMFDGSERLLKDVRYFPELKRNLLSIGMLDSIGCSVKIGQVNKENERAKLWHLRLGHVSERGLNELSKQGLLGNDKLGTLEFCENCIFGKSNRVKFGNAIHKTKGILDYIHSDLWGPSRIKTLGGTSYFISIIDNFSRKFKTPQEAWSRHPDDYGNLRIFGCSAYAHIKQDKLQPRALKCIFLGYPDSIKGYKLWCIEPRNQKCVISRDVVFNEVNMPLSKAPKTNHTQVNEEEHSIGLEMEHGTQANIDAYLLIRDRQRRVTTPPQRFRYADIMAYALSAAKEVDDQEPLSYKEAIKSRDNKHWVKAMHEEMESHEKN